MAGRVTIADVAQAAGVSVATVDRVLNRRRRVKPSTAEAVREAAEQIGFHAAPLLAVRSRQLVPAKRLGFVLQKQTKSFYKRLAEGLEACADTMTECCVTCHVKFVGELAPGPIIAAMRELEKERVDAIGVVALEHPHIHDEIGRLKHAGIPVWALLSSLSSEETAGFIGIDARKAGRTAAWGMIRCAAPGSLIGVLVGSHRYRSHEDREAGFRSYFREHGTGFRLHHTISYLDDNAGAYEAVSELGSTQPDLGGIYLIGGGGSGAVKAMRDEGIAASVSFICHELSPGTRDALIDGAADMILCPQTVQIAEAAVRLMSGIQPPPPPLRFEMLVSENL